MSKPFVPLLLKKLVFLLCVMFAVVLLQSYPAMAQGPKAAQTCTTADPSYPEGIVPQLTPNGNPPLCSGGVRVDPARAGTFALGGGTVTIVITNTSCGQVFSWTASEGVEMHEIVAKGGPVANIYDYKGKDPLPLYDGGLHSPVGPNGRYYGLSHIDFCFTYVEPLKCNVTANNHVTCFEGSDGSATCAATGGMPPYSYLWNDPMAQTSATATGLAAGDYTVTVTDSEGRKTTCSVTITQPDFKPIILTCGKEMNVGPCLSQEELNAAFSDWLSTFGVSGGTPPVVLKYYVDDVEVTLGSLTPPDICGGTITIVAEAYDFCEQEADCSGTFTVLPPEDVNLTAPDNYTGTTCMSQDDVDKAFADWLKEVTHSGGCNASLTMSPENPEAPEACGGSVTIIWTVTSDCEDPVTKSATFAIPAPEPLIVACPPPVVLERCLYADEVQMAYDAWKAGFTKMGDCFLTDNMADFPPLVINANGSVNLSFTYMVEGMCDEDFCTSTFTAPECIITCQTAYGKLEGGSSCFIDDGFGNWGWTNRLPGPGAYTMPLYAGAAGCDINKGMLVGTVVMDYTGTTLKVTYKIDEGYYMSDVQVYAGCGKYPVLKNGKETTSPGQYTYTNTLERAKEYTVTFTGVAGPVWVITHGVICDVRGRTTGDATVALNVTCGEATADKAATITSFSASDLHVYPNPFSTRVTFEFVSGRNAQARLDLFTVTGQKITTLVDRPVMNGELYKIEYVPDVSYGVILYRLTLDNEIFIGKLLHR